MREVDFSDRTVARRWREIKPHLREDLVPWTRNMLKHLLETCLEEEIECYLRASRHERTTDRHDYRNGAYTRDLTTELGLLRDLTVPRARTAGFRPQVFARYQRRQPGVNQLLRTAFISGVSTRQVGPLTALLLEDAVSASTVSRVTQSLGAEVARFHTRPLEDRAAYLLLDGVRLLVKGPLGARKRVVLCAYGLTPAGQRTLLSFRQVPTESEAAWTAFLTDLAQRGLLGQALRLIVTDGQPGLLAALALVYPYTPRQRCWVHKLRNVAARLPRRLHATCLAEAKAIYTAANQRAAVRVFRRWAGRWRAEVPRAVACLAQDLEPLLAFFACPPAHWRRVRTTNAIERAFREVRRRTRPMSCFTNAASCDRIIYAVIHHLNTKWERPSRREFTQNS
jgi:transposase-like protein